MSENVSWWDREPDHIKSLARKLCIGFGLPPDKVCLPYMPAVLHTVGGEAVPVDVASLRPLWSFCIHAAQKAFAAAEQTRLEDVLVMEPVEMATKTWEQEIGLVETPE